MELTDDQIIEAALEVDLWDIYDKFGNKYDYQQTMWGLRMFLKIISELDDHNSFFSAPLLPPSLFDQETEPDPEDLKDAERFQWLLQKGFAWNGCYNGWWRPGEWLYDVMIDARKQVDEAMAWERKTKTNP